MWVDSIHLNHLLHLNNPPLFVLEEPQELLLLFQIGSRDGEALATPLETLPEVYTINKLLLQVVLSLLVFGPAVVFRTVLLLELVKDQGNMKGGGYTD
jgi:hypothetical protein